MSASSVVPKPVLVSAGDGRDSLTSRYFTPRRCHASHAVTGAVGIATAFALPGTVASGDVAQSGRRRIAVLHPQGRIEVDVDVTGEGNAARVEQAALVRTARKILQGELHLPDYVFPGRPSARRPDRRSSGRSRLSCRRLRAAATMRWRVPLQPAWRRASGSR